MVSFEKWLILLRICIIRNKLRKDWGAFPYTTFYHIKIESTYLWLYCACKFSNKEVGCSGSLLITYYRTCSYWEEWHEKCFLFPLVRWQWFIVSFPSCDRIIFKFCYISFQLVVEFKNTRGMKSRYSKPAFLFLLEKLWSSSGFTGKKFFQVKQVPYYCFFQIHIAAG